MKLILIQDLELEFPSKEKQRMVVVHTRSIEQSNVIKHCQMFRSCGLGYTAWPISGYNYLQDDDVKPVIVGVCNPVQANGPCSELLPRCLSPFE